MVVLLESVMKWNGMEGAARMDDLALGWKGSWDRTSESRVWMDGEGRALKAIIKLLA